MNRYLNTFARILIAVTFIVANIIKIIGFDHIQSLLGDLGLPVPRLLLLASIVGELVCATCLLAGVKRRWVALALILLLVATTLMFHVGRIVDSGLSEASWLYALKNLAIIGGLLHMFNQQGPGTDEEDASDEQQTVRRLPVPAVSIREMPYVMAQIR